MARQWTPHLWVSNPFAATLPDLVYLFGHCLIYHALCVSCLSLAFVGVVLDSNGPGPARLHVFIASPDIWISDSWRVQRKLGS